MFPIYSRGPFPFSGMNWKINRTQRPLNADELGRVLQPDTIENQQSFKVLNKTKETNIYMILHDIDGLAQERRNSIANALKLRLSCTKPLTWYV